MPTVILRGEGEVVLQVVGRFLQEQVGALFQGSQGEGLHYQILTFKIIRYSRLSSPFKFKMNCLYPSYVPPTSSRTFMDREKKSLIVSELAVISERENFRTIAE